MVARTQGLLEQYESALNANGIGHIRIQHQVSDDPGTPGLRTATMHRVKGLEFNAMIIARVNDGVVLLAAAATEVDSDHTRLEFETVPPVCPSLQRRASRQRLRPLGI